jgi:hypothetical protein
MTQHTASSRGDALTIGLCEMPTKSMEHQRLIERAKGGKARDDEHAGKSDARKRCV